MIIRIISLALGLALFFLPKNSNAQKKYQGLLWEISGNGLKAPSYLYGTMHVSQKLAFHMGEPFFEAIQNADVVALELEPELWLDEMLNGDELESMLTKERDFYSDYYSYKNQNELNGNFEIESDPQSEVTQAISSDPQLLNYMLFRFYSHNGDFEEDTWLDMYIYQTGRKLNKQTMGLETYKQSTQMIAKAYKEMYLEKSKDFERTDYELREELENQMEPAYRRGDLDLIDSINRVTSSKAFNKYILTERNKVFVSNIDSLLKTKRVFAGMGCAHLPGNEGVIEMLRERGYTVNPIPMGDRDSKNKDKLENLILKRPVKKYTSPDKTISFDAPTSVYSFVQGNNSAVLISLDIPNGASFAVTRKRLIGYPERIQKEDILLSIDSVLYEAVPGTIVSQKKILVQGHPAFDIINKTRRGDYQHTQVVVTDDELLIIKFSATGDKVKKGFGKEYFTSFKLQTPIANNWSKHTSIDQCTSFEAPGKVLEYGGKKAYSSGGNQIQVCTDPSSDAVFVIQQTLALDNGFPDEDDYELKRLADAFYEDRDLKEVASHFENSQGRRVLISKAQSKKTETVYCYFQTRNLDYFALSAMRTDSLTADRFFKSFSNSPKKYETFYPMVDTTLFFTANIPWKKVDNPFSNQYSFGYAEIKENNLALGAEEQTLLAPPNSSEYIKVSYQRSHRYYSELDSLSYLHQMHNSVTNTKDFIIEDSAFKSIDGGFMVDYILSDTLCTRKLKIKKILKNQSEYSVQTSIDGIAGESDFVKEFYKSFTPTSDSLSKYSLFENKNKILFNDLMSSDSATYKGALELLNEFSDSSLYYFKKLNENSPPLASESDKKDFVNKYHHFLYEDSSAKGLQLIKDQYKAFPDSAEYQAELLWNLAAMQTDEATKVIKQLLIEEAPIGVWFTSDYNFFDELDDSLELAKFIYPESLDLVSLIEYQDPVYSLFAELVDSNLVKKETFTNQLPQFLREARAELKRINSTSEEEKNNYDYYGSRETYASSANVVRLIDLCSLLWPFKESSDVKSLFNKIEQSKKKGLNEAYFNFLIDHNQDVSKELCEKIIDRREPELTYLMLKKAKHLEYLPVDFNPEKIYVEDVVKGKSYYSYYDKSTNKDKLIDSIAMIDSSEAMIRSRFYTVYNYKILKRDDDEDKDPKWMSVVVALKKSTDGSPSFDSLSTREKTVEREDKDETEKEQFAKMWKRIVAKNRKNLYYEGHEYLSPVIWTYESDY